MIVKNIQVGQIGTNCYLLGDEESKICAIVDPGDEGARIEGLIAQSGMTLGAIFITHGHYDHCLAVSALQKAHPEVPVYVHRDEVNVEGIPNNYMKMAPCAPMIFVDEGAKIAVGQLTVEVLHTPGHSPGSLVLLVGDAMFAGDTLFQGSCGRTDFHGGSYGQMMASLKRLHDLPGDRTVYPGHEGFSTLEKERQHNQYMQEACQRQP